MNVIETNITVDRVGGLGDGMATHEGKPVIVPKSVEGDVVRAMLEPVAGGQYVARDVVVEQAGPTRRTSPCPHDAVCGGCNLQQLTDEAYRDFKHGTLAHALRKAQLAVKAAEVEFLPIATRRRAEFALLHKSGQVIPSYYAVRSHHLQPISTCLVLAPELQTWLAQAPQQLAALSRWPHIKKLQLTLTHEGIDAAFEAEQKLKDNEDFAAWAVQSGFARVSVQHGARVEIFTSSPVTVRLGAYDVKMPPGAFLQASVEGQQAITRHVVEAVARCAQVADLFSGLGTYSLALRANIDAFEGEAAMVRALQATATQHGLALRATKRDLFAQPLTVKELERYDAVVINPPRAGAKVQCEMLAKSLVKKVVMVSCNPATFARDAQILAAGGYACTQAVGVDQFGWTTHLEIVAVFDRAGG